MFGYSKKKNRVGCEVILERMRQEAHRRRGEGRPAECWAPSLTDSVTGLQDIRVECDQDDPERVWRLGVLLEEARKEANKQRLWNEILHDSQYRMGVKIGEHEREITSLQAENERLRDESAVANENERLQEENARLRAESAKSTKLVEDLEDILCCPISLQLLSDPVVSKVSGISYEREYIEKCLKIRSTCHMTGMDMTREHLVKNYTLGTAANAFRAYLAAQEKAA